MSPENERAQRLTLQCPDDNRNERISAGCVRIGQDRVSLQLTLQNCPGICRSRNLIVWCSCCNKLPVLRPHSRSGENVQMTHDTTLAKSGHKVLAQRSYFVASPTEEQVKLGKSVKDWNHITVRRVRRGNSDFSVCAQQFTRFLAQEAWTPFPA